MRHTHDQHHHRRFLAGSLVIAWLAEPVGPTSVADSLADPVIVAVIVIVSGPVGVVCVVGDESLAVSRPPSSPHAKVAREHHRTVRVRDIRR